MGVPCQQTLQVSCCSKRLCTHAARLTVCALSVHSGVIPTLPMVALRISSDRAQPPKTDERTPSFEPLCDPNFLHHACFELSAVFHAWLRCIAFHTRCLRWRWGLRRLRCPERLGPINERGYERSFRKPNDTHRGPAAGRRTSCTCTCTFACSRTSNCARPCANVGSIADGPACTKPSPIARQFTSALTCADA
jgi:hypothetical protein